MENIASQRVLFFQPQSTDIFTYFSIRIFHSSLKQSEIGMPFQIRSLPLLKDQRMVWLGLPLSWEQGTNFTYHRSWWMNVIRRITSKKYSDGRTTSGHNTTRLLTGVLNILQLVKEIWSGHNHTIWNKQRDIITSELKVGLRVFLCTSFDHALYLCKVSWINVKRFKVISCFHFNAKIILCLKYRHNNVTKEELDYQENYTLYLYRRSFLKHWTWKMQSAFHDLIKFFAKSQLLLLLLPTTSATSPSNYDVKTLKNEIIHSVNYRL